MATHPSTVFLLKIYCMLLQTSAVYISYTCTGKPHLFLQSFQKKNPNPNLNLLGTALFELIILERMVS